MDISILWGHFNEVWLNNTKQLLLYRNSLGKQGNVIAQPENQMITSCSVLIVQYGTGNLGADTHSSSLLVKDGVSQC